MNPLPNEPKIIWSGTINLSREDAEDFAYSKSEVQGRVVAMPNPTTDYRKQRSIPMVLKFEIVDGQDAMGAQRWKEFPTPFPEFLSNVAKTYFEKGAKP